VKGGVRDPNQMQSESNADNKWPECTLPCGGSNCGGYLYQTISLGESPL